MEKLIEREAAPRRPLIAVPALAVQFFLIPLAVVAVTVVVYLGFRSLLTERRSPHDYIGEVRNGSRGGRWLAAMELWRMMDDPAVQHDRTLAPALVAAFDESKGDDPRVRQYLALAISRLDPPLPADAVATLSKGLDDADAGARISAICALGASGDPAVAAKLQPLYQSDDPGVRKMVVYALGALPGDGQIVTLRTALQDPAADVRWNAAVALARRGRDEGIPVIGQMLDRSYVEQTVKREARQDSDQDPIADVMISGLRAAAALRSPALRPSIESLSQQDRSFKVRQAAIDALKVMRQNG